MNIYFSAENDDYLIISEISLKPFNNCFVKDLSPDERFSVEDIYYDKLIPYQGEFTEDISYYSKDGKHFMKEEEVPENDWNLIYEYAKTDVYKDGKLINTKYEKY